ncbi:MAG: alpha/beta fold hydrolase [Bacteroidota bacterium]
MRQTTTRQTTTAQAASGVQNTSGAQAATPAPAYQPPWWLRSGHAQTVFASLGRGVPPVPYRRERLDTDDGDFLDLDWLAHEPSGSPRPLAVVAHGLEGNTHRPYMVGMARTLHEAGFDVLAWNFRGCSEEPNRLLRSYHSGATDDLRRVLQHAERSAYTTFALVGFSLGGNLTLKYLAEEAGTAPGRIAAAVAISVPVDLAAGAAHLARWDNQGYMLYFMRKLRRKVYEKAQRYPALSTKGLDRMRTFQAFDDAYTAPIHGFRDADDYWARCSAKPHLHRIAVPTLLLNAADDPFLPPACYPHAEAEANSKVTLEVSAYGGHVGFVTREGAYWSERRAAAFFAEHVTVESTADGG